MPQAYQQLICGPVETQNIFTALRKKAIKTGFI